MKIVKLGSLIKEYSIKYKNTADDIPVYSVTNSSGFKKSTDYFNKEVFSADLSSYKLVYKNSFAYNPSRINVGSISYQGIEDVVLVSPLYNVFSINEKITPRYLNYFFKSNYSKNYIKNHTSGSVRSNFRMKDMSDMDIILPSLDEQERFVDELNDIEYNIALLTKQVNNYDEIVKSQFIEMFGNYDKTELSNIAEIIMGQSPESKSYNDIGEGVPFFQGKADYGEKYTIVKHWTTKPTKMARKNSILMSVRAPVGPVNIANVDCCIGRGLCSIDSLKDKTNNEFLYNALKVMESDIALMGSGSTFKAINKNDIYNLMLPNAPLDLQNDFSLFAQQIDKSKYFGGVNYAIC